MHPERKANPTAKRPKAKNNENDAMVKVAWAEGWWCKIGKSGYIKVYPADPTQDMILIESTPSDHHSTRNTRNRLRRAGLKV